MAPESGEGAPGAVSRTAELENLEIFQDFLLQCAARFGLERRRTGLLTVAIEEIFVNICHYAYPDAPGPVTMRCHDEGNRLVVEIVDEGQPFNADTVALPDLEADLESRKIGGLGWFIVRQAVDDLHCYRKDGRNIVTLALNR